MKNKKIKLGFVGLGGKSVFMGVDHFHLPGETLHAKTMFTEPGGKGYNQAVAAQRLGADTVFIGAVGNDESGRYCEDFLKSEGVKPVLQKIDEVETACAFILTDARGENQVTVFRGAADFLSADFVRECKEEILSCDMLVLGLECPMEATLEAAEIAFENAIPVILNPAPVQTVDIDILKRCYLITPNQAEAAQLFGLDQNISVRELAEAIIAKGMERAVVTLGGDGALLVDNGNAFKYDALSVKAVDTTGAGDTFNAAIARALTGGYALREAVVYAMNAASISVTCAHVMDGLPSERELLENYVDIEPQKIL